MDNEELIAKFYDPDDKKNEGFEEVLRKRQVHKNMLRDRLKKNFFLYDDEIDNLFKILEKWEIKIEKLKRNQNYNKLTTADLLCLRNKTFEMQLEMKTEFDKALTKFVKENSSELHKRKEEC